MKARHRYIAARPGGFAFSRLGPSRTLLFRPDHPEQSLSRLLCVFWLLPALWMILAFDSRDLTDFIRIPASEILAHGEFFN